MQVACGNVIAPPDGCLQYYPSPQGSFATFNYLPNGSSQYLVSPQSPSFTILSAFVTIIIIITIIIKTAKIYDQLISKFHVVLFMSLLTPTLSIFFLSFLQNNLNYVVCVGRATAFCSITYSAGDRMDNTTFQMVNFSIRNGTYLHNHHHHYYYYITTTNANNDNDNPFLYFLLTC